MGDNSNMDEYADLVMEANAPEQHGSSVIVRQAHGVVGICAPWNFPVEEIVLLSIPALVAGNAIVVKPSEVVPLSGKVVVGCLMEGLNNSFPGTVRCFESQFVGFQQPIKYSISASIDLSETSSFVRLVACYWPVCVHACVRAII